MKSLLIRIKSMIPWRLKLIIKIILSLIPNKERLFKGVLYINGGMDQAEYAYGICDKYYKLFIKHTVPYNKCILELGPGDSVFSAIFWYGLGCESMYLVDVAEVLYKNIDVYVDFIRYLLEKAEYVKKCRRDISVLINCKNLNELLSKTNAIYLTEGLKSLQNIPSGAIDYIYSNAVLEHVYRGEFREHIREFKRILKMDAMTAHVIDYRDHMGGDSINHLRFSERFWESRMIKRAGLYTNRLRHSQMMEILLQEGFENIMEELSIFDASRMDKIKRHLHADYNERKDIDIRSALVISVPLQNK